MNAANAIIIGTAAPGRSPSGERRPVAEASRFIAEGDRSVTTFLLPGEY